MITVRELIDISPYFLIRVNGDDYDKDDDHYADNWVVEGQNMEIYTYISLSSCEPGEVNNSSMSMYLDISADEPDYSEEGN